MCSRYDIAGLQKAAEAGQISRRTDGTLIYRIAPDRWVDGNTLQSMLEALLAKMQGLNQRLKGATAKEVDRLKVEGRNTNCA